MPVFLTKTRKRACLLYFVGESTGLPNFLKIVEKTYRLYTTRTCLSFIVKRVCVMETWLEEEREGCVPIHQPLSGLL